MQSASYLNCIGTKQYPVYLSFQSFLRITFDMNCGIPSPFLANHHVASHRPWGSMLCILNFPDKITLFGRKWRCLDELHKEVSYFSTLFIFVLNHLLNNFTIPYLPDIQLIHIIQCSLYRYNVSPSRITLICLSMLPSLYYRCLALSRMINTKSSLFSRLAVVTWTITRP